ncbi:hypothetical protein D9M73_284250 [compost metagenome]
MPASSAQTQAIEPTINGMFSVPGPATHANSAGSMAVMNRPEFCAMAMADTR